MKSTRATFLRDLEAGPLLDAFLLTAVVSVLGIRVWLHLSGYPKLGGDSLHIAHMLWGGLLMLAALVLLLGFLDRPARRLAVVLGGVGFGTFIDEVGKFITHDNDYFYRPAVSVMYVVFLLLYLAGRYLTRRGSATGSEYVVNALREVGEIAVGDLDPRERDRAIGYLEASGDDGPLVRDLRRILAEAELVAAPLPGRLQRAGSALVDGYRRLASQTWFGWALILFFTVKLVGMALRLTVAADWLAPETASLPAIPLVNPLPADLEDFALAHWLQLGGSLVSGAFVALGVVRVFGDRLAALRSFQASVIASLCLNQVFVFYRVEWLGIGELAFNLLVLAGLRFAIGRERRWSD
ncbi:hypothetical protein KJ682_13075 [bacterium]|nr:hypothetical protein [bacterium]